MTSSIIFNYVDKLWRLSKATAWSQLDKLKNHFKMSKIQSLKSDHVPKWVILTCVEAKNGYGFEFKMFLMSF